MTKSGFAQETIVTAISRVQKLLATQRRMAHSGPIYYILNYNLLEESHDKSALVNVSSAPNWSGKDTTSFSNHRDHRTTSRSPSPASSPGLHKDTPGSSRRGQSSVCLTIWQLFHVQHQAGWVEKTGTQAEKSTQDWGQKIWHRDQTLWPDHSKALGKSISVCFLLLWSTILTKSNMERKRLI